MEDFEFVGKTYSYKLQDKSNIYASDYCKGCALTDTSCFHAEPCLVDGVSYIFVETSQNALQQEQ